jgi:uncharacterized protein involved in exopolysaccharide biosynthesis
MLQVRLDDYAADGAHFDSAPMAGQGTAGAQPAGKPRLTGELHFNQVVVILRRRSSMILAIAGIGVVLAIVAGLLIPPKYTAMAQLVIQAPPDAAAERAPGVSVMDENIDTHVTLLSSRDHLQHVIESLLRDPEFRSPASSPAEPEPTAGGGVAQSVVPGSPIGSTVAQMTSLGELKRRLEIWLGAFRRRGSSPVPSLEEFERDTRVIQERRSRVISVGVTSTSPEKAAAFANRIVQLYVDDLMEQKEASTTREMARLEERIAEAKTDAEKAGAAVQEAIQQRHGSDQDASSGERGAGGQLQELLRRAGSSAQLYDSLLRRRKEMRDRLETVSPGVGIHLLAGVPDRPSSHNPILFIFPAFMAFAIGGSWLAVVLERLDRGLRSRQETAGALGIPCMGLVPLLSRRYAACPYQHLLAKPFSAYAEAIRSAAATLGLAARAARSCRVVLISSSVPREGKTTLAVSLAAYLGILGQRVLLLDLDSGDGRPLDDFPALPVRHMAQARFEYLPIANCGLDPLTLFAREQIPRLVSKLRESYDCVIIDGPPVMSSVEARLLLPIVDKLLLVVKWGSTRREMVQNALSLLCDTGCPDMVHSNRLITIVTQVDLKKHARYRYGDIGEFPARRGKLRFRFVGVQPGAVSRDPTPGARDEQEHRPKVSGDEADGRSV